MRISDWSSDVCSSDLYDVTYKNQQTTVTVRDSTGAPATALINAAEAKDKGFEAELTVRPVEGLMLHATRGVIDGKLTKRPEKRRVGKKSIRTCGFGWAPCQ